MKKALALTIFFFSAAIPGLCHECAAPSVRNPLDGQKFAKEAPYLADCSRRIRRNWPVSARKKITKFQPIKYQFSIQSDGKILNIKLVDSSGLKTLDELAEKTIKNTKKLRRPPKFLENSKLEVIFLIKEPLLNVRLATNKKTQKK